MLISRPLLLTSLLICSITLLSSCQKDAPEPQPKDEELKAVSEKKVFLLGSLFNGQPDKGVISYFSLKDSLAPKVTDALIIESSSGFQTLFSDGLFYDGSIYAVSQYTDSISRYSTIDFNLRAGFSENRRVQSYKTIEQANNIIFTSYTRALVHNGYPDPVTATYIKSFNAETLSLIDSTFLQYDVKVNTMKYIGDKLLISYSNQFSYERFLAIYDLNNNSIVKEIALDGQAADIVALTENVALIPSNKGIYQLNLSTFELQSLSDMPVAGLEDSNIESTAFNQEKNILYYFASAAQPSPTASFLASYNLTTGESTYLTDYNTTLGYNLSIKYLEEEKMLIICSNTTLYLMHEDGELVSKTSLTYPVQKILIEN